jgi:hypothetical protein
MDDASDLMETPMDGASDLMETDGRCRCLWTVPVT